MPSPVYAADAPLIAFGSVAAPAAFATVAQTGAQNLNVNYQLDVWLFASEAVGTNAGNFALSEVSSVGASSIVIAQNLPAMNAGGAGSRIRIPYYKPHIASGNPLGFQVWVNATATAATTYAALIVATALVY